MKSSFSRKPPITGITFELIFLMSIAVVYVLIVASAGPEPPVAWIAVVGHSESVLHGTGGLLPYDDGLFEDC